MFLHGMCYDAMAAFQIPIIEGPFDLLHEAIPSLHINI